MLRPAVFALLFATSFALAQNVPKQLTARELFYPATQAPPPPQPPPPPPAATPKAPAKSVTRAARPSVRPVEIARADTKPNNTPPQSPDAGVKIIPAAAQTAPLPANGQTPLGLRINVLRY